MSYKRHAVETTLDCLFQRRPDPGQSKGQGSSCQLGSTGGGERFLSSVGLPTLGPRRMLATASCEVKPDMKTTQSLADPGASGRPRPSDGRNHVLRALPSGELDRFDSDLQWTSLARGRTLYQPGDATNWIYFPEGALLSVCARLRDGGWVETNVVGHEGAVGLLEASAKGVMASHVRVHAAGDAWRASCEGYRALARDSHALRSAAHHHAEDVVAELRQSAICHTHHTLDERLCRWILERHDQLGGEALSVTRACLAELMGAQRTSVSESAGRLQQRRLIRSARSKIFVLDRKGLEAGACECRGVLATARRTRQAAGPHLDVFRSSHPATLPAVV